VWRRLNGRTALYCFWIGNPPHKKHGNTFGRAVFNILFSRPARIVIIVFVFVFFFFSTRFYAGARGFQLSSDSIPFQPSMTCTRTIESFLCILCRNSFELMRGILIIVIGTGDARVSLDRYVYVCIIVKWNMFVWQWC